MKQKKTPLRKPDAKQAPPARAASRLWWYAAGIFLACFTVFEAYGPVLYGPFVFDDRYLPFNVPNFSDQLRFWLAGVRPLLMLSYWLNFRISGLATFSYHLFNILFHTGNSLLIYFIVRRLLAFDRTVSGEPAGRREALAIFAAGLFLLHPVQTESVSYVASRSENLSLLFLLGAFTLFLYRRAPAASWSVAAGVLLLFGAAVTVKEHAIALVPLLLLTDYYWNPGFSLQGIRRNWRLYGPMALGGLAGAAFVWRVLQHATTAGFAIKDFTWYQYFFTECRAIFVYIRLYLLPVGQNADYDFPISRTILDHGAIAGLLALVALAAAAIYYRRRYPLASYGLLAFLILLAPTSSIVPIKDPIAERRIYLAMPGLLLITVDALRRTKADYRKLSAVLALVLLVAAVVTYNRNQVWSNNIALWQDTLQKSPGKPRAHFQLAYAYYSQGRCDLALSEYEKVSQLQPVSYDLLIDWALAYDCAQQPDQALGKLRDASHIEPTAHVYSLIGMVYAKQARWGEALETLDTAQKIDPNFVMTYVYRGGIHTSVKQFELAVGDFERALQIDPGNESARAGLSMARAHIGGAR